MILLFFVLKKRTFVIRILKILNEIKTHNFITNILITLIYLEQRNILDRNH
jgi:hypothetical protein